MVIDFGDYVLGYSCVWVDARTLSGFTCHNNKDT